MSQRTFKLTGKEINGAVEEIRKYFTHCGVAEKDVLRLSLLLEETLLRYRDKFGRDLEVQMRTSRFSNKVTFNIRADKFNPLIEDEENNILSSQFVSGLLEAEEATAVHRYHSGVNEIVAEAQSVKKGIKIPGGGITIAILLAIVAAVITKLLIPENIANILTNEIASPLLSRLMGVITLITGPLIFVSVLSGICALDDIATLSSIGLKAIGRFLKVTIIMITFSVLVSMLFFPGFSFSSTGAFDATEIFKMLLDLIPQDIVSPFVENKVIQIIVIATVMGIAMLVLGEKVPRLRSIVSEANYLIFDVMNIVSKIIPFTVFLSIYKAVAVNDIGDILDVWKVVVSTYAIMVPFTFGMVAYVCLRRKINMKQFLHDIAPSAIIGFTTASSTLAMTKNFEIAKDVLKKDEKLVNFFIPLSHAMFSPSVVVPLITAAFFACSYYGTPLSLSQLVILYILVTQLSIASPKVPGGIMATFAILLGQLGMSTDIVGLLMVSNVFVVNAMTGLAMIIRTTELEEFSDALEDEKQKKKKNKLSKANS